MKRRTVLAALASATMAPAGLLAGCGGGNDGTRVRLLNASRSYTPLDLYVDGDAERTAVAYGTVSDYASLDDGGGSYTLALTRNASGTYIYKQSQSLDDRKPYTLVAFGTQGSLTAVLIKENEDPDDIDSGNARVQVVNAASDAGSLDVYLTGEDDSIDDAIAFAAGAAVATADTASTLGYLDVVKGTYRLRVTAAGDKTDLRLDVSGLALADKQIANLVIAGAAGGVLVDAMLLTQEGSLTSLPNASARVRLVAGVTASAVVVAAIGETSFGSGVASSTVGSYLLVPAGSPTPAVTVNGATVSAAAVTIAAGTDYTLLVYGDAAAPLVGLIADDNRLPTTSGDAKMRLVHAVAGYETSLLSLTVNLGSVATGTAYGTASAYKLLSIGSNMTLTVTVPGTSTALYTLQGDNAVTLLADSVYTVFMLGASSAPTGQLLLERQKTTTSS